MFATERSVEERVVDDLVPATLPASEKLALIAAIVNRDVVEENQRLRARVRELEGNLQALKDMIGGL